MIPARSPIHAVPKEAVAPIPRPVRRVLARSVRFAGLRRAGRGRTVDRFGVESIKVEPLDQRRLLALVPLHAPVGYAGDPAPLDAQVRV